MRTIEKTVYKFSELSDTAKERAKYDTQCTIGYPWAKECITSLKKLAEHFDGELGEYSIDWFNDGNADFLMPDMDDDEIRRRLDKLGAYDHKTLKGYGDCVLTGYCADESAIDGLRAAHHKGQRDLNTLMQAAFKSWIKDAISDCKYYYDDKQFSEDSDANGYEYYENGKLV